MFAKRVSTCSGSLKPVQTTVAHNVVPAQEEVEEAAGGMVETGRRGSRHSPASFIPSQNVHGPMAWILHLAFLSCSVGSYRLVPAAAGDDVTSSKGHD